MGVVRGNHPPIFFWGLGWDFGHRISYEESRENLEGPQKSGKNSVRVGDVAGFSMVSSILQIHHP